MHVCICMEFAILYVCGATLLRLQCRKPVTQFTAAVAAAVLLSHRLLAMAIQVQLARLEWEGGRKASLAAWLYGSLSSPLLSLSFVGARTTST